MFQRKVYRELLDWKSSDSRETLVVEGFPEVGKTSLMQSFGESEYRSCVTLDLTDSEGGTRDLLRMIGTDLDGFYKEVKKRYGTRLYKRDSLIILDSIQRFPPARRMADILTADGRYDIAATGSLVSADLGFQDRNAAFRERRITLRPMDFEEFMWAMDERELFETIRTHFEEMTPMGGELHERAMGLYGLYMILGGLPHVIAKYKEKPDGYREADILKRRVLLNMDYHRKRTLAVFTRIPVFLLSNRKMFSPGLIRKGSSNCHYVETMTWLRESDMVNFCYELVDPDVTGHLVRNEKLYKLYMPDTGVLGAAAERFNKDRLSFINKDLEDKCLDTRNSMLFENVVAQELVASGYDLGYTRFTTPDSTKTQIIDFVVFRGDRMIQIRLDPQDTSWQTPMKRFATRYWGKVDRSYAISMHDLRVDGIIMHIPVYMTCLI